MRRVTVRALLPILLLASTLAGCTSGGEEEPDDILVGGGSPTTSAAPVPGGSGVPNATGTPGPSGAPEPERNTLPTASLEADATEAEAPVDIVFTIDAADEDGDDLTWALDADGDGAADSEGTQENLPFSFTFTFGTAGTYTATLTVGDGMEETVEELEIVITAVSGYVGEEPLVFTGETLAPSAAAQAGLGCWIEYDAVPTGDTFDMGGDRGGWTYTLDPASDYEAIFYDEENVGVLGSGTGGTVPNGSFFVDVCGMGPGAAGGSFTLTVYPPGHPDAPA